MKICYLCPDHGIPVLGRKGCSTHVRETCRGLIEAGHEVTIVTPNRGDDDAVNNGFDFRIIPPYTRKCLGADLRLLLLNYRILSVLRSEFRLHPPDVIYERYALYAFAGRRLAREFNIPRILEVNAHLVDEQRDRLHFPWLAQRFEDHLLRVAQSVVVVSQPLKDSFVEKLKLEPEKVTVMHMAVDVNRFAPGAPARDLRQELGITAPVIAGYAGTLTKWHGIDMIHGVGRHFADQNIPCALVIIGGDKDQVAANRQRVRDSRLDDRIFFTGSVPYADVPGYLNAMDITFIPSSTQFASPTKLFEYQAMAKPSVAPALSPIRQVLTDGEEGLLFEPGDTAHMTQCLIRLVQDSDLRTAMGHKARQRVVASHSWEVNVNRIVEMYEKMLDSKRAGQ